MVFPVAMGVGGLVMWVDGTKLMELGWWYQVGDTRLMESGLVAPSWWNWGGGWHQVGSGLVELAWWHQVGLVAPWWHWFGWTRLVAPSWWRWAGSTEPAALNWWHWVGGVGLVPLG